MRHSLVVLVVIAFGLVVGPAIARADEPEPVGTTPLSPTTTPCAAMAALPEAPAGPAKCRRVATTAVAGLGSTALYAQTSKAGDWTRYAIVVSVDGTSWVSASVDVVQFCGMGGRCDSPSQLAPKLRAITVDGNPAVALDLHATYLHTQRDMATGKVATTTPWQLEAFLVCGGGQDSAVTCQRVQYGSLLRPCTASLDSAGTITHRCDEATTLTFAAH